MGTDSLGLFPGSWNWFSNFVIFWWIFSEFLAVIPGFHENTRIENFPSLVEMLAKTRVHFPSHLYFSKVLLKWSDSLVLFHHNIFKSLSRRFVYVRNHIFSFVMWRCSTDVRGTCHTSYIPQESAVDREQFFFNFIVYSFCVQCNYNG